MSSLDRRRSNHNHKQHPQHSSHSQHHLSGEHRDHRSVTAPPRSTRLLLISSRARNKPVIYNAVRPEVKVLEYIYDSTTLEELQSSVTKILAGHKVSSIAMVLHSSERELFICAPDESRLSLRSIVQDEKVRRFLTELVNDLIDHTDWSARVDFLATYMAEQIDGGLLAKELEGMLGCQVGCK